MVDTTQNVTGFFQSARFANYLAINGDAPTRETLHLVFHEYTHYYLASQFAGEYPPWFNEGHGRAHGLREVRQGHQAILEHPMVRVYEAREADWIPFERLIRADSRPEYQIAPLGPSFYAQSWLTVHYGMVEDRDFGKQIFPYLTSSIPPDPQDEAAAQSFRGSFGARQNDCANIRATNTMSSGAVNLGEVPPVTLPEGANRSSDHRHPSPPSRI